MNTFKISWVVSKGAWAHLIGPHQTKKAGNHWLTEIHFESKHKKFKMQELCVCFPRLTRILTRLPALRLMNSSITEELFFTGLIGNVSIDSIIPYILKMETAEYNSQDSDPTEWPPRTVELKISESPLQVLSLPLEGFAVEPQSKILQPPLFKWCMVKNLSGILGRLR